MLVFKTEASVKTGFQYLEKSVYLASLLRKNVTILFCINQDKKAIKFLQEKKFPFCLPKDLFINPVKSIVLHVDNPGPADKELLNQAKKNNINTVQIAAPGRHLPETDCQHLLSLPTYAIVHNKFRHFNQVKRKYRKKVKNIIISLEDAVEYRELRKIIDLLYRHRFNLKIVPTVYIKKSIQKILKRLYPGLRFVGKVDSLARPFFEADIALILPGYSAYETAAAGTPALYLPGGKKQAAAAEYLESKSIGIKVSHTDEIIEKIGSLTFAQRIAMGQAGKNFVDGKGVYRIVDFFKEKGIIDRC